MELFAGINLLDGVFCGWWGKKGRKDQKSAVKEGRLGPGWGGSEGRVLGTSRRKVKHHSLHQQSDHRRCCLLVFFTSSASTDWCEVQSRSLYQSTVVESSHIHSI